jgi:hypothetical protein
MKGDRLSQFASGPRFGYGGALARQGDFMGEGQTSFQSGAVRPVECIREGWELVKGNYWLVFLITLVGSLLAGAAPFGILAGPMMCGIYYCLFRKARGESIKFEMLFKGFDHFVQSLIATLIMMIPVLAVSIPGSIVLMLIVLPNLMRTPTGGPPPTGWLANFLIAYSVFLLALLLVSIVVTVLFFFVYPLILDRKLSWSQAIKTSIQATRANLGGVIGLVLLNYLLTAAGGLACYVGAFFVMPIHFAAIAVAYRKVFPDHFNPTHSLTPEERDYDDQLDLESRPPERGEGDH